MPSSREKGQTQFPQFGRAQVATSDFGVQDCFRNGSEYTRNFSGGEKLGGFASLPEVEGERFIMQKTTIRSMKRLEEARRPKLGAVHAELSGKNEKKGTIRLESATKEEDQGSLSKEEKRDVRPPYRTNYRAVAIGGPNRLLRVLMILGMHQKIEVGIREKEECWDGSKNETQGYGRIR